MPFTEQQFLAVFSSYNAAMYPAQLVLPAMAVLLLLFLVLSGRDGLLSVSVSRVAAVVLALLWTWTGAVYHLQFFATINPAARVFGFAFIVQGLLFMLGFAWRRPARALDLSSTRGVIGILLCVYALIVYPLLNKVTGIGFLDGPPFGAPCPTTIYTLGVMLLLRPVHPLLWLIPLAWSAIGGSAAVLLGVLPDYGLIAAGLLVIAVLGLPRFISLPGEHS